jgi:hypothetical protein
VIGIETQVLIADLDSVRERVMAHLFELFIASAIVGVLSLVLTLLSLVLIRRQRLANIATLSSVQDALILLQDAENRRMLNEVRQLDRIRMKQ